MQRSRFSNSILSTCLALVFLTAVGGTSLAQPVGTVRYTEAVRHAVRRTVQLPGSVVSRKEGVVASEAAGLVVEMAVQPGDRVQTGDVLVRLRERYYRLQLAAAEARLREAEARRALAESNLRRAKELFDDEVISQGELDDASSEFTAWAARIDQTNAEIDQIKDSIERSQVQAPYDGVVVAKRTELGQWIELGAPVVELVALNELQVRVEVPERYFDSLKRGGKIDVGFEALGGQTIVGDVESIVPRADPQSRTFPVKIAIRDPAGRVGVGMLATVALPVGDVFDATLVPKDSVLRQGDQTSVFRINGDETVESVPVKTGQGVGGWIVVNGPVEPGQRVVTRGNERLRPGQAVHAERMEYTLP